MRYVNISKRELTVPGVGLVGPGKSVDLPKGFHNANFREKSSLGPTKSRTIIKIKKKRKRSKKK